MTQARLDLVWKRFILEESQEDFLEFYEGTKLLIFFRAYLILRDRRKANKACAQIFLRLRSRNFTDPSFMPWENILERLILKECNKFM